MTNWPHDLWSQAQHKLKMCTCCTKGIKMLKTPTAGQRLQRRAQRNVPCSYCQPLARWAVSGLSVASTGRIGTCLDSSPVPLSGERTYGLSFVGRRSRVPLPGHTISYERRCLQSGDKGLEK